MRNTRFLLLFVFIVVVTFSCRTERSEAVRFCQSLDKNQAALAKADADERALVASMIQWASGITFAGGSSRDNVSASKAFAQNVDGIRAQVESTRQALEAEKLDRAFNQTVRSSLVNSLKSRGKLLEEVSLLLRQSAQAFPRMGLFQYPGTVNELLSKLRSYSPSDDILGSAIKEVRTKFDITDQELGRT